MFDPFFRPHRPSETAMKRIAALAPALAVSAALLLGAAGAADADCGGGYVADALPTHLHYRFASWSIGSDPDGSNLGLDAPRHWSFVRTPQGEGRFHSRGGNELLSLRPLSDVGTPAGDMRDQVAELAGTSGLKVIGQHVQVVDGQTWATLAYQYTSMGEPRSVKERWIAYGTGSSAQAELVVTVAGRAMDAGGLDAMLAHVTPTVVLAG
jgi:hypothetical protein